MQVYEAGRNRAPGGVEGAGGLGVDPADGGDGISVYRNVGRIAGRTSAVNHGPALDEKIKH